MARGGISAQAAAAKWQRRLQAAGQDIQDGVNGVTVSPGQKAAAQMNVWLANLQAAANRWAESMRNLTLDSWKQAMLSKGVSRIVAGATAGAPKVQQFMADWLAYEQNVVASLPARGGLEQNLQRANEVARQNAAAKGKFRQSGRSR